MRWTNEMIEFLTALLSFQVIEDADVPRELLERFDRRLQQLRHVCPAEDRKLVESYARRIGDDYHSGVFQELQDMYGQDSEYGEWPGEYITWNEEHRDAWTHGVAAQRSVRLRYESQTSGETERMVDPYHTQGAYGIGYCHLRKEVRMFRFDRVIDIQETPRAFTKSRDWEQRWKEQQRKQVDQYLAQYANPHDHA